jgi:pilus assembly protein TadC
MKKKGYFFIVFFSLFISISHSLKYRLFIKRDLNEATLNYLIAQMVILFFVFLISGTLLVRWYHKMKHKNE